VTGSTRRTTQTLTVSFLNPEGAFSVTINPTRTSSPRPVRAFVVQMIFFALAGADVAAPLMPHDVDDP